MDTDMEGNQTVQRNLASTSLATSIPKLTPDKVAKVLPLSAIRVKSDDRIIHATHQIPFNIFRKHPNSHKGIERSSITSRNFPTGQAIATGHFD